MTRRSCVFARVTDAGVALGVRDRGRGIDPAEQERIFQKFVRGADAKAAGTRGVGIGLALVKTIALAHRGAVAVQSDARRRQHVHDRPAEDHLTYGVDPRC